VDVLALDLDQRASFNLNEREPSAALWQRYPQGVAVAVQDAGHRLRGMNAVYAGDVPIGSGLSSSAAVEVAFARAFAAVAGLELPGEEIARLTRQAENEFVGVPSGVMDQFISALGAAGSALLLDCRTLAYRLVPIALPGVSIVVMDTGVRRNLATSEYRRRRADCEAAVAALQARLPGITALRDVSADALAANRDVLDEVQYKRAAHVVHENARTLAAAEALARGDAVRMGALMHASHESLRDLYEVSSPELDALVEIAWHTPGVVGARMTGAGFGGAAVALVRANAVPRLEEMVAQSYPARTGREARLYVCTPAAGASVQLLPTS
jgi:galactokinase